MADQDDSRAKDGLKTALAALGPGDPPAETAEQLPLLPLERAEEGEALDQAAPRRGPGRPKGSSNKRTQEWVEYLSSRYRSPLEVLAATYSMPVEKLAAKLSCKREEAFKIQVAAARELAPYVHQKMPQAVELDAGGAVSITFQVTSDHARSLIDGDKGGGLVIDGEVLKPQPGDFEEAGEADLGAAPGAEEDDGKSGT